MTADARRVKPTAATLDSIVRTARSATAISARWNLPTAEAFRIARTVDSLAATLVAAHRNHR